MTEVSQNPAPTRYDVSGGPEQPEILVAMEHAPLVERLLARAEVTPTRVEHSEALLLSRFQLQDKDVATFREALPGLLAQDGQEFTKATAHSRIAKEIKGAEGSGAGDLLARLRAYFRLCYAGWVPTMGKNRLVALVNVGGGTVSHGGGPDPVPAAAPAPRAGSAGTGVVVGILDTALWPHEAFAGRDLASADLLERQPTYPYASGHATFVAGLVLEQAPGATLRVVSCLGSDGQATSWDVAQAIVALGREGVDILNLSLVCYTQDRRPPLALASAVDRLDPAVLVIACAGNHGDPQSPIEDEGHRQPAWPAALDDVVAVGSARRAAAGPGYELDPFTPQDAPWIDVLTRGGEVTSTYLYGEAPSDPAEEGPEQADQKETGPAQFIGGARWGGTSFSAARLTGRVAAEAAARQIPPHQALQSLLAPLRAAAATTGPWQPPFLDLD